METTGFSSPRPDSFPAGLRVLVVDDDPTWLKILEKMLKKCSYEVTTCNLAREALNLLRERKEGFDIVISDVNMPDMDGFKLLEHVGLEMDLPVIMMSVDGETSRVMKGVQHGACDYLLKPIRMKELRNIWQHVFRKRIHEVKDIESHESLEEIQMMRNCMEQSDDGYSFSGVDMSSGKKRKDVDNKPDDRQCGDPSSVKKARVVWTVDLHQKFVNAVHQFGFDKVGPKKILDVMGVPWLTRENVASHLQKYRLYLSRLQKENELKASFVGTKQPDTPSKDAAYNVTPRANGSYAVCGNKIPIQNIDAKFCQENVKTTSVEIVEPEDCLIGDITTGLNHSFGQIGSDVKNDPNIPTPFSWPEHKPHFQSQSWTSEVQPVQFKQEPKPQFQSKNTYTHLPLTNEKDKRSDIGPHCMPVVSTVEVFPVKPESHLPGCQEFEPISCPMWSTKNQSIEHVLLDGIDSSQRNLIPGIGSGFRFSDEGLQGYSCQVDFHPHNAGFENIESFGFGNQELVGDLPPLLFDSLKPPLLFDSLKPPLLFDSLNFDYGNLSETIEYPVIDQGVFIA